MCFGGKKKPIFNILGLQKLLILCLRNREYKIVEEHAGKIINKEEGFCLVKNEAFGRWKSLYKNLKSFDVVNRKDELIAKCWYSQEVYNGEKVVFLYSVDLYKDKEKIIKNSISVYAFCLAELFKINEDAAFIRTWVMARTVTEKILQRLLFIKSKHPNPFIVFSLKEDVVQKNEIEDTENWKNLSFFDLD